MVFSKKKKEVNLAKILSAEQIKEQEKPKRKSVFFSFKSKGYREDDWGKYQFQVAETETQEQQRKEKVKQVKSTPSVLEKVSAFFYGELEDSKKTRQSRASSSIKEKPNALGANTPSVSSSSLYSPPVGGRSRASQRHSLNTALSPQKIAIFNELSSELKYSNDSASYAQTHPRMSRIRTPVRPDENFKVDENNPSPNSTRPPSPKQQMKQRRRGRTSVTSSRLPDLDEMKVDSMRKVRKSRNSMYSSSKEGIERRSISKGTRTSIIGFPMEPEGRVDPKISRSQ